MVRYHFSGVAGAGMSPLAQLMRARGHAVQGSDRALDQGKSGEIYLAGTENMPGNDCAGLGGDNGGGQAPGRKKKKD